MKKSIILIIVVLITISLIGCEGEEVGIIMEEEVAEIEMNIAVIRKGEIWNNSLQTRHYQEQLKKKIESITAENEVNIEDLSEAEKAVQHDEIYNEIKQLREELRKEAKGEIDQKIAEVAKERDVDIVFNKQNTRFGGSDITDEVIKRLDENINDSIEQEGYNEGEDES